MKALLLFLIPVLISCSHEPMRSIASEAKAVNQEIEPKNSSAFLISKKKFLIQVKNVSQEEIELNKKDVQLKNSKGKIVPFEFQRISSGKYYLLPSSKYREFQISVQGKAIGKKIKLDDKQPVAKNSSFTIVNRSNHEIEMVLKLADENNRPIESDETPEIIVEGVGTIEGLKYLGNGLWQFSLNYPEHNLVLYLSVRSHEVYLERIFRFQHVEKSPW